MHTYTKTTISAIVPAVALLALAACGGGGGSATTTGSRQGPVVTMPPESEPPVCPDGQVGTPPNCMPPPPFDTIGASWRRSHDGEPASRVAEYLGEHATVGGIVRFASPPLVRVAAGASDRERTITAHAVAQGKPSAEGDRFLALLVSLGGVVSC